jgi:lysophospholipase L1-like esterase
MKSFFSILIVVLFMSTAFTQTKPLSYLALGDSYTIGESVALEKNFPHQVVSLLRKSAISIEAPAIIAKTGWTTDELQEQISRTRLAVPFDFVTLLIGVNNQYRGRSEKEYSQQFEELLQQAIGFSGDKPTHVIVLSIPDWGVTPFAKDRDRNKIAKEIDQFNAINEKISKQYNVHYINITPFTREAANDQSLVAEDGLHPSAKDYARWAKLVAEKMLKIIR